MVTAYGDDERRRRASEYGAAEFLAKPVDFAYLKARPGAVNFGSAAMDEAISATVCAGLRANWEFPASTPDSAVSGPTETNKLYHFLLMGASFVRQCITASCRVHWLKTALSLACQLSGAIST